MEHVIINGELMRLELASLPVIDRAVFWGESLREDIMLINSNPFRLKRHIDVLARSLALPEMGFSYALRPSRIERNIATLASRSAIYNGNVRIILTPGVPDVSELASILLPQGVNEIITLSKSKFSSERIASGLELDYACYRLVRGDWLSQYRIGAGMREYVALRKVRANGFDDAVVCDQDGAVLAALSGNVFAVVDGAVVTPHPVRDGVVDDVFRQVVCETLAREGIILYQQSLTPELINQASEFFLAGVQVRGVVKVGKLGEKVFKQFVMSERIISAVNKRIMKELPVL